MTSTNAKRFTAHRWLRALIVAAATLVAVTIAAPAAQAATATASLSVAPGNQVHWKGSAVGMHYSWAYSWHIELYKQSTGHILDTHDKRNFSSTTSTSTGSYINAVDPIVFPGYYCTRFALHHGTTNSGPLEAEATSCNDPNTLVAPTPPDESSLAPEPDPGAEGVSPRP